MLTRIGFVLAILINLSLEVQVQLSSPNPYYETSVTPNYNKPANAVNEDAEEKLFIIDTDAGSDDGVAIFNILGAAALNQNIKVIGITCVNGNTNVDNVVINVLKILKTANRLDIPVYRGFNDSILFNIESDSYYGSDGFGDFEFPDPPSEDLISDTHAVNALVDQVKLNPGKISLVCLGPLTNIAMAIRLCPNFLQYVKEVFILGGSTEGVGNMKPGIEFNFFVDPEAVFITFDSAAKNEKILTLLPWDTATRTGIPMEWRKEVLGAINSPQVNLLNKAEADQMNIDEWLATDAFLSAIALDQQLIETSDDYHVNVETCGSYARGGLLVGYGESAGNATKNIEIVQKINVEGLKEMLLRNLNPSGGEINGAGLR